MQRCWPILCLIFALTARGADGTLATNISTNWSQNTDRAPLVGPVIFNQTPSSAHQQPESEDTLEWLVEIFRALAWPALVAWALWFLRREIRSKLAAVVSVKGGEKIAVEFANVQEQQKASASAPNPSEITASNQEFEKLKADASRSPISPV